MLLYHHCRSLDNIVYGLLKPNRQHYDPDYSDSYLWLEKEVGFYPLFLAVGTKEDDIRITGYDDNWRVRTSYRYEKGKIKGLKFRRAGEFPNLVLFSFEDVKGIFIDDMLWCHVLGAHWNKYNITSYDKKRLFKPSWSKSRWLRKALIDPGSVQLVTESLYLPSAKRIYVKNKHTKKLLESKGFENVEVKRIILK